MWNEGLNMAINTEYLQRCLLTLEKSYRMIKTVDEVSIDYEISRWMKYRDNRNNTAHDYGQAFAEETLTLIEDFIKDVNYLKSVIENE